MYCSRSCFVVLAAIAAALFAISCGRNQHLVSIQVQPSGAVFGGVDPALAVNFKAYGTYIHPPQTKDITNQVTWTSDTPQVAQVTAGVVSPNLTCGNANITATFNDGGNTVVSNGARITVDGPASSGCPQNTATHNLSVDLIAGRGDGVITSSPGGISCGTACSAAFPAGSPVALTPAANGGHSFLGWASGCTSLSSTTCNVTLTADTTVQASFN